jgi:hypothetical protein
MHTHGQLIGPCEIGFLVVRIRVLEHRVNTTGTSRTTTGLLVSVMCRPLKQVLKREGGRALVEAITSLL